MKTVRARNQQIGTTPKYTSEINTVNDEHGKFNTISIVSVKMRDFYENSGAVIIKNLTSPAEYRFSLSYPPINQADLLLQLNQCGHTNIGIFSRSNDYKIQFEFSNLLTETDQYTIEATGNMQYFIGQYGIITLTPLDRRIFSSNNSMNIQYIQIKSQQIDGNFQTSQYFDNHVLCVLDRSQKFTYINKNLDVHMNLDSNNVNFQIVDQDNKPVDLAWCLIEFVLYNDNYFQQGPQSESLGNRKRHTKRQMYIRLTPQQQTMILNDPVTQISLSDLSGYVNDITGLDFVNFFNIYLQGLDSSQPLTCAIVDSNLILSKVNNDIFTWETFQGKTMQLKFQVKKGYNQQDQDIMTTFPNMILRLLVK